MMLCAACCDIEATLDLLAMEEELSGGSNGKSENVQNQKAEEKGKFDDQTSVCDALIH